jgi:enamine deaminase RidA (YjgF/YER057c/UK114 family)
MLRKESNAGLSYAIVETGKVRRAFAVAAPQSGSTFAEQAEDVLHGIEKLTRDEGLAGAIVKQSVFLSDADDQQACRRRMLDFYGRSMPATEYVIQTPCNGKRLAIEVWATSPGEAEVHIDRLGEDLVIARHQGINWAYLAQQPDETAAESVYHGGLNAFEAAGHRLVSAGFRFDEVIRTWLYLGDITGMEGHTPRYYLLNRARTDYYSDIAFGAGLLRRGWEKPVYPASTGIGAQGKAVAIGCIALKSDISKAVLLPLENPRQTSACDYDHPYGSESPKFARAIALESGNHVTVFISGTASITTSKTQHIDDVKRQTHETLDNIGSLISVENFRGHGFAGFGATLKDLALARVYVKRQDDYAPVREICRERLGELPTIYTVCDLCRPELLVEIEGVAFSR